MAKSENTLGSRHSSKRARRKKNDNEKQNKVSNEKQNKGNNEKQNKAVTFLEDLLKDAKAGNLNHHALQLLLQTQTVNNAEAGANAVAATATTATSSSSSNGFKSSSSSSIGGDGASDREPNAVLSRAPAVKTVNNAEAGTTTIITSSRINGSKSSSSKNGSSSSGSSRNGNKRKCSGSQTPTSPSTLTRQTRASTAAAAATAAATAAAAGISFNTEPNGRRICRMRDEEYCGLRFFTELGFHESGKRSSRTRTHTN